MSEEKKSFVQRVPHDKQNPYVMTNRDSIQDKKLSWQATGLLTYLLSLPLDWVIRKDELCNHKKNGRDATRTAFNELIKNKYILEVQLFEGTLKRGKKYYLYETPYREEEEELKKCLRYAENPQAERATLINKEYINKRKQLPLTPSSKSKTPKAKKKVVVSSKNIKERESSTLEKVKRKWIKEKRSTALIEEVFKRFKNTALDEIYNLEKWLEGTLVKVLEQQQKQSDMKELTEGRKKICEKRKGWYVLEKGVATMSGAIENFYKFNGSEEFWEKHKLSREHFEEYKMSKKTNKQIKNPEENKFLLLLN